MRPCVTLSDMNISETSGPNATKFDLNHHDHHYLDGLAALLFWTRSDQNSGSQFAATNSLMGYHEWREGCY